MVTENAVQRILQELSDLKTSLTELKNKSAEIQDQGRENGTEIRLLRKELGLDSGHGRLPVMETTISRIENRQEINDKRVDDLESTGSENLGRQRLVGTVLALASGGVGTLIGLLWHR
jgi:predicted nuclease with TOPRIM domain